MAGPTRRALRARKGEEYLLDKRLAGYVKRVVFPCPDAESKGILLIPTYDGTLMVGPTAHWTAQDGADKTDLDTTAAGARRGLRRCAPPGARHQPRPTASPSSPVCAPWPTARTS